MTTVVYTEGVGFPATEDADAILEDLKEITKHNEEVVAGLGQKIEWYEITSTRPPSEEERSLGITKPYIEVPLFLRVDKIIGVGT